MVFTAVDIGNSSVKVTRFNDNRDIEVHRVFDTLASAAEWVRMHRSGDVAFCSTRSLSGEEIRDLSADGWWELNYEKRLPFEISYATPETLGPDRIAAVAGALSLFPGRSLLVADVGTAVTIDLVEAGRRFVGGNISPGIEMRFEALHAYTSRLPLVEWGASDTVWGRDTVSAIRNGVRWGVVYEIAGAFAEARKQAGCNLLVLTGGGAALVRDDLIESLYPGVELVCELLLVAYGLLEVYKYNHDK